MSNKKKHLTADEINSPDPENELSREFFPHPTVLTLEEPETPPIPFEELITISQSGTEEIIYKKDYPETNQVAVTQILFNYASILILISMFQYLATGIIFLQIWVSQLSDVSSIFLVFSITMTVKIITEAYFTSANKINSIVHLKSVLDSIGNLVVYQAFYLYLIGLYTGSVLVLYLVLNISLQFVKMLIFHKPHQSFLSYTFSLIEAISYFLIALKLDFQDSDFSWTFVLAFYTFSFYVFLFLCFAFTFFVFIFSFLFICGNPSARNFEKINIVFLFAGWTLFCLLAATYCLAYIGLRKLLESGNIKQNQIKITQIPAELGQAGILMLCLSFFGISFLLFANLFFKTFIIRNACNSTGKQISIKKYFTQFALKMKAVSGNFFKKDDEGNQEINASQTNTEKRNPDILVLDDCVICQTDFSSYLLSPCNHCVFCDNCVKSFLEFQSKCPLCKVEISRAVRICFNHNKRLFEVDSVFKISNF